MPNMRNVGDLKKHRDDYLRNRFINLTFLFEKRFNWMSNYIHDTDEVLEVGCGIGVTKMFLNKGNITLSDVIENPWVDRQEDALNLSYSNESIDVIIANNTIHHFAHPLKFFQEANRVLKKGGRLLIQDINCSFMMQRLLRFMNAEAFDFNVDVFDINRVCTNSDDLWDGNNAIPNLLFDDVRKFEANVPYFKVVEQNLSEFLVYVVSGGISGKTFAIPLPYFVLKILDRIDNVLIPTLPMVFALQRRVILEKR
jgi:SAM-dependent methyltransferase